MRSLQSEHKWKREGVQGLCQAHWLCGGPTGKEKRLRETASVWRGKLGEYTVLGPKGRKCIREEVTRDVKCSQSVK